MCSSNNHTKDSNSSITNNNSNNNPNPNNFWKPPSELKVDLKPVQGVLEDESTNIQVFGDQPELTWKTEFPPLDNMKEEHFTDLAIASSCLQSYLEKNLHRDFRDGFRIELRTKIEGCILVLRVSSLVWFERHLLINMEKPKAIEIARKFLNDGRRKVRNESVPDPSPEKPIDMGYYCPYGAICRFAEKCLQKHPKVACIVKDIRKDGATRPCGWSVWDELVLTELESKIGNWLLYARADPIRDVLLSPLGHTTNSQMVKSPIFWQMLIEACKTFDFSNIENIYLNFGVWETRTSNDTRASDCHAHAHINLSRKSIEPLGERFPAIKGRIENPPSYVKEECDDIEGRLHSEEIMQLTEMSKQQQQSLNEILAILKNLTQSQFVAKEKAEFPKQNNNQE